MPIFKEIHHNGNHIAIWQIDESEYTPQHYAKAGLSSSFHPQRKLERLAVKSILNHLGLPQDISYMPNGRPFLDGENPNISISHADNKVVVASNSNNFVGVDIERIERQYQRVLPKFLTERELCHSPKYSNREFALIWCIKEAVYKLPWEKSKCLSTDIEVLVELEMLDRGWCSVKVKNDDEWKLLKAFFTYIDNYCLVWVNMK